MSVDVPWASTEVMISSKDQAVARIWCGVSLAFESPWTPVLPQGGSGVRQSLGLLHAHVCLAPTGSSV